MAEEMLTLDDLAKLKRQREEEKSRLSYQAYLDNLKILIGEKNPKIYSTVNSPKSNNDKQFVCIKEPVEFIALFSNYWITEISE